MREVWRVLKPGGTFIIVAEAYKGGKRIAGKLAETYVPPPGMTLLTANEHRELFANAGYTDVQIVEDRDEGWICAVGRKPMAGSR
jgi:hypothetical protein